MFCLKCMLYPMLIIKCTMIKENHNRIRMKTNTLVSSNPFLLHCRKYHLHLYDFSAIYLHCCSEMKIRSSNSVTFWYYFWLSDVRLIYLWFYFWHKKYIFELPSYTNISKTKKKITFQSFCHNKLHKII